MTLEARLIADVERHFPDYKTEGWTVTYWVCKMCGWHSWLQAGDKGKGFKVQVGESLNYQECDRCREVRARAPEVFWWVLNVVSHQSQGSGGSNEKG